MSYTAALLVNDSVFSSAAYRTPSQPTLPSLDCFHVGKQCEG